MQLYSITGGNIEDLNNKQYNIGVGISLGNKWFSVENIVELVKWSFKYTKENVVVYVADSIHAINLEVRNRISKEKALEKADKAGDDILREVELALKEQLNLSEFNKVIFVKWTELLDQSFLNKTTYLKDLYLNNLDFKNYIHSIVRDFTSKEDRVFSDEDINRFGDYIIEEMPEIINRINMRGVACDAYAYPFTGKLIEFTDKIQKGEIFPEIKENVMDTEPKVFLEVR